MSDSENYQKLKNLNMESMIPSIDRFCHRIFHLLGAPSQLEWGVHDDAGLRRISLDLLGKCSKLLITEDREQPAISSHAHEDLPWKPTRRPSWSLVSVAPGSHTTEEAAHGT